MEVRLNATSGLLFYVASEQPGSFMAVLVSNGRFVLLADLGGNKLRIQSKDKYHDRRWHTVSTGHRSGFPFLGLAGYKGGAERGALSCHDVTGWGRRPGVLALVPVGMLHSPVSPLCAPWQCLPAETLPSGAPEPNPSSLGAGHGTVALKQGHISAPWGCKA